jgi:hypothetical protein
MNLLRAMLLGVGVVCASACIIDAPRPPYDPRPTFWGPPPDAAIDIPPPTDAVLTDDPDAPRVGTMIRMRQQWTVETGFLAPQLRRFSCGSGEYIGPYTAPGSPGSGRSIHGVATGALVVAQPHMYLWDAQAQTSTGFREADYDLLIGNSAGGDGVFLSNFRGRYANSLLVLKTLNPSSGIEVVGEYRFPVEVHEAADVQWRSFAVTPLGVAAVIRVARGFERFFVGSADFRTLRMVDALPEGGPQALRASGDRVVVVSNHDLYLYTFSTATLEPLVRHPAVQQVASIDGDIVAWTDARHDPGSYWLPRNTEIYMMNLRDRKEVRLTHDPAERPVIQGAPVVHGDWIFWRDWRMGAEPDRFDRRNRTSLVGYHLRTRKTYLLEEGHPRSGVEGIQAFGDYLYFACEDGEGRGNVATFRRRIPDPASLRPLD